MFLGIEIGGTKLQAAAGDGGGRLVESLRERVDTDAGAAGILAQIERLGQALLRRHPLQAIGVGFGGPVDDRTQTVVKSHQIEGWENFSLSNWLSDRFRLPAVIGNDADVAGLGEALHGAGQGISPLFYVTIGSGIGGGFILDGRIFRGFGMGAAEIGHLRVESPDGRVPLESVASGWGIESRYRARTSRSRSVSEIAAAVPHDALAHAILSQAWDALAEALCHVVALIAPRRIILGGGVSLLGDVLFSPVRALVKARVFRPFADGFDIVPAALGEDVVLHGALALARTLFSGSRSR